MNPPVVYLGWFGERAILPEGWIEHSRFARVINVLAGEYVVSVCARGISPGPYRLVLSLDDLGEVRSITREEGVFYINGSLAVDTSESIPFPSHQEYPQPSDAALQAWLDAQWDAFQSLYKPGSMPDLLLGTTSDSGFDRALAGDFTCGIRLLEDGYPVEAARMIKGKGHGFTPAGDDFLCGLLTAMAWLERTGKKTLSKSMDAILNASWSSNPLLNTFYRQARHLELNMDWVDFLKGASLGGESGSGLMEAILAHGSTSGSDELLGFFTACRVFGDHKGRKHDY